MENNLFIVLHNLNASQYDNTLFSFTSFFLSQIVLYFLHNTSVLSFHIDVVLTLSIINEYANTFVGRFNIAFPRSRIMSIMKLKLSFALKISLDNMPNVFESVSIF